MRSHVFPFSSQEDVRLFVKWLNNSLGSAPHLNQCLSWFVIQILLLLCLRIELNFCKRGQSPWLCRQEENPSWLLPSPTLWVPGSAPHVRGRAIHGRSRSLWCLLRDPDIFPISPQIGAFSSRTYSALCPCRRCLIGYFYTLQIGSRAEKAAGICVPNNKDREWPPQPVLRRAGEKHTTPNSPKMSRLSSWASESVFKECGLSDRDGPNAHMDCPLQYFKQFLWAEFLWCGSGCQARISQLRIDVCS